MNDWQRLTLPLRRRLKLMLSRAVGRLVDPATLLQTLQIELLKGEVLDNVEHLEGYGRTAHPPAGFEALAASLGGDRAHTICLAAVHRKFRVRNLAPGEQALYDDLGNVIHFKRDRILISAVDQVEVTAPVVTINAATTHNGDITINGNVQISGALSATGQIASDTGVSIGALELGTHVHGGVTAGTDSTGGPQ